jgi:hypothetical protein
MWVKITLAIVHEQELVGVYISIDRPCEKRQRTHAVRNERVRVRAYIRVRTGTYVPWSVAYFHVLSLHDSQKKKNFHPPCMWGSIVQLIDYSSRPGRTTWQFSIYLIYYLAYTCLIISSLALHLLHIMLKEKKIAFMVENYKLPFFYGKNYKLTSM